MCFRRGGFAVLMGKAVDSFLKKFGDLIVGICYLALGIALIIGAKALPKSTVMDIGPDFMPIVVGSICIGLSVLLLVQAVSALRKTAGQKTEAGSESTESASDYVRVIESLVLALVYVNVLKPVGFIISTLVYLALQIFVLAPNDKRTMKDIVKYVIIDVIFTLVVYFLFRYGFKIVLPAGILKL